MISYEKVFTYENLERAYFHCRKGKRYRKATVDYHRNYMINLTKLQRRLLAGTYKPSSIYSFVIYEPKKRFITANYFEDKIVQEVLTRHVLEPLIQPKLIYDNYATQKKKGSSLALKRLKKFIYQYHKDQNWSAHGWVLSCDIKKYFYTIDQQITINLISKLDMDDSLKDMIAKQITAYGSKFNRYTDDPNRGICIGFQTSQWIAIYYLNGLDHFIKEKLHIRYYGRYMDDFYLIHESKEYLQYCWNEIQKYVEGKLNLELNKKTHISRITQGVCFIGYRGILNQHTHQVELLVRRKSIRRERKRLRKQICKINNGELSIDATVKSITSWYSYMKQGTDNFSEAIYDDLMKTLADNTQGMASEIDEVLQYNLDVYNTNMYTKKSLNRANLQLMITSRCNIEYPEDI